MAGFDAAIFNTLKDLRDEQKRTNQLLEQLVQVLQGQPRQWYPEQAPMPAGPWPPVQR